MTSKGFKTLFSYDTVYSADSVEWCPISPYQNYFVCGTYQLTEGGNENKRGRKGTILLFCVEGDKLNKKSCVETSAILDLKWCPSQLENNMILGAATADGEICILKLFDDGLKFVNKCVLKKGDKNEDFLVLSLDWCRTGNKDKVCASDSKGNITTLKFINGELKIESTWNAHSLEAWIVCFDQFNPNVIFSGGDDAKLNVWDQSSGTSMRIGGSNKHTAGVTVLSCHPKDDTCFLSGGYDEKILMWDTRNWKDSTKSITASGGLWRLKWEPRNEPQYLLAACIYGGFDVIQPYESKIVGQYKEHESLAYGADWCHSKGLDTLKLDGQALIATCSFYDHKLCVSLWDKNKEFVDGY